MSPGQRKRNLSAVRRRRGAPGDVLAAHVGFLTHHIERLDRQHTVLNHQVRVARDLAGETWGMVANHGHELRQLRRYVHVGDFALRLVIGVIISAAVIATLNHFGGR